MIAMSETISTQMRPLKGILLVVLATLAFAMSDAVTKQQTMRHPVSVVVAVRYLVSFGLLTLFLEPRLGPRLWRTDRRWLVFLRGLCLAFSALSMGLAPRLMPVGETIAIIYLAPFAVMLLAIPILGERVGPRAGPARR
jgi:drug/metabolite transporter (DMT)-like permease